MSSNKCLTLRVNTAEDSENALLLLNGQSSGMNDIISNSYQNNSSRPPDYPNVTQENTKLCPKCKGKGIIDDQRSSLSTKKCMVRAFVLLVIALVAITPVYFLSRQKIQVTNKLETIEPYEFNLIRDKNSTTIGMIVYFEEEFNLKNFNFYDITLKDIELKFKRHSQVSLPKLDYSKHFKIPALSEKLIKVKVKLVLYEEMDAHVNLCIQGLIKDLFASVRGKFTFNTILTSEMFIEFKENQYIDCQITEDTLKNINSKV
jgi:hypothetical protein